MPKATAQPRRPGLWAKLILLLLAFVGSLLSLEVGLRFLPNKSSHANEDVQNLAYGYDPELGWFPIPGSQKQVTASRTITASHNSLGFRTTELVKSTKPVLIFLGDSLVWGFDAEAPERFTEKLQERHPEWAVYNLGVSGYGTDQEFLVLQKYFDLYQPRAVFLVICGDNDNEDNAWNCRGGYYKPYYTLEAGRLKLNGVPVPKSEKTFRAMHPLLTRSRLIGVLAHAYFALLAPAPSRNPDPPTGVILLEMRRYVSEKGAQFGVGLQHANAELEKFLNDFKIPYVDLSTSNASQIYPEFGKHWTPEGHIFVANKIDDFFKGKLR